MQNKTVLITIFLAGIIWSGINPHDYFTWILEVFPAVIGLLILLTTYRKFRFTDLTYNFILIHCYILFLGGHYTYAEVPLFDWFKETFHQARNNYDKVGHFAQGFVPAMIVRELLIRGAIVKKKSWQSFLTVCVCISISAFYELLEWFVAISTGESAESFLGTQGYIWDTQSDMMYAITGSISMIVLMSYTQDIQIKNIENMDEVK
jgi:putative membrane protein